MMGNSKSRTFVPTARQGSLDMLCGVYAVVNSTSIVLSKMKTKQSDIDKEKKILFDVLCKKIDTDGSLLAAVTQGIGFTKDIGLKALMRTAGDWLESRNQVQVKVERCDTMYGSSLDEFWSTLQDHFRIETESGKDKKESLGFCRSVILGMEKFPYNHPKYFSHWTCIDDITSKQMNLSDSETAKTYRRSQCTVGSATSRRPIVLWPTQTLLISVIEKTQQ